MKIGIDVRNLSKPLTGIGRYTLELCLQLAKIPDTQLFLYSPAPIIDSIDLSAFEPHTVRCADLQSVWRRQLWAETTLPKWATADAIDIFWGPAHRLPYFLPRKIPSVVTIHDLVYRYHPRTMRLGTRVLDTIQMPLAIKQADHILADSGATQESIYTEFKVAPLKVSIVYNGVSKKMGPIPRPLKFLEKKYILFVGTLEPRKNLVKLLWAYSALDEDAKQATPLVIAGGKGWGDVNLEGLIHKLNLSPFVHLLGYVDDPILQSLYANALFLAMPSLYEGFGLPLIESMSYGVPILTSNTSSMPEVAGDAGYLVDPLNVESIKNGLLTLITDIKLHQALSQKARPNADRFSWEDSAHRLRTIFEKVIMDRQHQ
ncbi:MAG: glycosyltransferase family 1 protein [Alphaproteobacteria bacterium]|nr:glycosyltransferase family 1 protein [Alphaproteobacteria bacterium]